MLVVPFSCKFEERTLIVSGYLDENAIFPVITSAPFEAVNMQAISGFSSLGLKHFLQFLCQQPPPQISLLECPISFIDSINAISGLIKGSKLVIESLLMPCRCPECLIDIETLVFCADVMLEKHDIHIPPQKCHICRSHLTLLVDPWEYFLFLYS
jgi:hypothetical protein